MDGNINGLAPRSGKGCRIRNAPRFGAEINMIYRVADPRDYAIGDFNVARELLVRGTDDLVAIGFRHSHCTILLGCRCWSANGPT